MTIISIDSNNPKEIADILQEVIQDLKKHDNCLTEYYEYTILPEQDFISMANYLHFDNTGNRLV